MRFASSSEPGGGVRPAADAPAAEVCDRTPPPPAWREAWRGLVRFVKGVAGLDAYDRYVRHARAHHPDAPVPNEADFWRERWDGEERNPRARCC